MRAVGGEFRYKRILPAKSFGFLIERFNQGLIGNCLKIDFVGNGPFGKPVENAVIKLAEVGRLKFEFLAFTQAQSVS
jgi:hypothetical protein